MHKVVTAAILQQWHHCCNTAAVAHCPTCNRLALVQSKVFAWPAAGVFVDTLDGTMTAGVCIARELEPAQGSSGATEVQIALKRRRQAKPSAAADGPQGATGGTFNPPRRNT